MLRVATAQTFASAEQINIITLAKGILLCNWKSGVSDKMGREPSKLHHIGDYLLDVRVCVPILEII